MFSMRTIPRAFSTLRFKNASPAKIYATLAAAAVLGSAMLTATSAYGASAKAQVDNSKAKSGLQIGVVVPDAQSESADLNANITNGNNVYATVRPDVKTLLVWLVLYDANNCKEYTPGYWELKSNSSYGNEYEGYVYGHLSNGACKHVTFKGRGIYYKWVYDINAKKDKFKATWYADQYYAPFTFYLTLKK